MITAPSLIDRAVAAISPRTALKRLAARHQWNIVAESGGYVGARNDRRGTQNWTARANSADADILPDLVTLRQRSRDLARNAPIAAGALNTSVTNVIGTGLKPTPRIDREMLGMSDEAADRWERDAARAWCMWSESQHADSTGEQNFYELQSLGYRGALESGDLLFIKRYIERPGAVLGYCLQAIEADRLSNPNYKADGMALGANTICGGIERNSDGQVVAYHISDHPGALMTGATARKWQRFPALTASGDRAVLMIYERLRPDQSRGVPFLAPVLESLKEIDRYMEAERMAAVVSALFTVFVKSTTGQDLGVVEPTAITGGQATDKDWRLGSGAMVNLGPGDDITIADPKRPNVAFEAFVKSVAGFVGAALEIPRELLLKEFTASYSASRAALLEAWKSFKKRRAWFAARACQPVYEDVIGEFVARGILAAPGFFDDPLLRRAWLGCRWVGPAPGQIDPLKEAEAATLLIEQELSTREAEAAAINGSDWEENHAQRTKEETARKADGLDPVSEQAKLDQAKQDQADQQDDTPADAPDDPAAYAAQGEPIPPINVHVTVPPREPRKPGKKTIRTSKDAAGNLVATVIEE